MSSEDETEYSHDNHELPIAESDHNILEQHLTQSRSQQLQEHEHSESTQHFHYQYPPQIPPPNIISMLYPDQDAAYPSIPLYPYTQFMPSTALPGTSATSAGSSSQVATNNPNRQRRNALVSALAPKGKSKVYRHKKQMENLSISSGLNIVHINDEHEEEIPAIAETIKEETVEGHTNKKAKTASKQEMKETDIGMRQTAINSMRDRIQIKDLAKQLRITRSDIEEFQRTKPTVRQSQERERNKNIFAIRCLLECFRSTSETLETGNFKSKVLAASIKSVSANAEVPPFSSIQQSKSASTFIATARSLIYSSYTLLCDISDVEYLGQSGIGKLVRIAFPAITTKRLGNRGNSKYHYVGISAIEWMKELIDVYEAGNYVEPTLQSDNESPTSSPQEDPQSFTDFSEFMEKRKDSLVKAGLKFEINPQTFYEPNPSSVVKRIYQHLSGGEIDKLIDSLMNSGNDVTLRSVLRDTLLFISPLSFQLGDNTILNNLNFVSLNVSAFEGFGGTDYESTRYFLICLERLIKASRCSLSVSNMLFVYHEQLARNLRALNLNNLINLEIDDIFERFLFVNFFQNFETFLNGVPDFLSESNITEIGEQPIRLSSVFSNYNVVIMKKFVEFLIVELKNFETKNLKYLLLNFSKVITSINDEILRNTELNASFNNWWILNCWLNEWLNFCCELIAFKNE